jgi:UDP-N-acetyl-2-amino-2-deoxyglucuronate dehydrogenase
MARRTFGFGIVGCGVIAPHHAMAIADLSNARLVAVVDENPERAAEAGAEFGVEHYAELDVLLERPDVDVVCVCVPSGLHAAVGVKVATAGKHVVTEKPIEVTLEAADELIAACRRNHVTLSVISQHRYDNGVRKLHELMKSGHLGRLVLGSADIKWYRTQEYYDSGAWRGTWALDGGGALMNQGAHYVDLLQWVMGPVQSVFARCSTVAHERIEVEDVAVALLTFANGAVGTVEASTAVYPGLPERLEITGTGGTVVVEEGNIKLAALKERESQHFVYDADGQEGKDDQGTGGREDPRAISYLGHRAQIGDVLDSIEAGRVPLVAGDDARNTLEIILAIYESARTGRVVTLPLPAGIR